MSRIRDLTKPNIQSSNSNHLPSSPTPSPIQNLNHSEFVPPMRPQRSAARQPGIIVSNPISHLSNSNHQTQSTTSHHKLYQAINHSSHPSSRPSIDHNPYLDPNYRSRHDIPPSSNYSSHQRRPSTASSNSSMDNESSRDLLSPNDLKDAKKTHGARNAIAAFSHQIDKRTHQKPNTPHSESRSTPSMLDNQSYPQTLGFHEIERVIQKIKLYWDFTGITESSNHQDLSSNHSTHPKLPFSAFGLAIELLQAETPQPSNSAKRAKDLINKNGGVLPSLSSFLKIKLQLEQALQTTIQANYRQFDASINSYKLTKASVETSHKKVIELKAKMLECKTTLGNSSSPLTLNTNVTGKAGELNVLQSRRELLTEMLKLIDTIDRLKQVPETLESLISSKNFLSASVLLVRSIKVISKPELIEIGALNDLRSYLVNQESVLFEILIEELHNHLYLKNYYCNSKWRPHQPGQVTLPVIATPHNQSDPFDFRIDQISTSTHLPPSHSSDKNLSSCNKPSSSIGYLQNYLNDLMTQPQSNPLVEQVDLLLEFASSYPHSDLSSRNINQISTSDSNLSYHQKPKNQPINPELDSFKYIESLIESFAVLGKLGLGLDAVLQRVPVEIYALVESTLNEVDERYENTKRFFTHSTTERNSLKNSINLILLFMDSSNQSPVTTRSQHDTHQSKTSQKLSIFKINHNKELRELELITHILQDFFWTLYSKFDGTLQSFRVLYEVSSRIGERKSFKAEGSKSDLVLFSLLEVWKPMQSELLALIHTYLTESNQSQFPGTDGIQANETKKKGSSTSSTRNAMASIAEVLKINISGSTSTNNLNMVWKDPRKQLFKFKDAAPKQSLKEFNAHETNVYSALKVSVPGLVLDSKLNSSGTSAMATGIIMDDSSSARSNNTHRLLVQPDAFHITHLLKPTLEFLKRAKEVLPSGVMMVSTDQTSHVSLPIPTTEFTPVGSNFRDDWEEEAQMNLTHFGGFSGFFDEFVLHTFLPQLEEKIILLFEHSVNAPDAFHDNSPDQPIHHAPFNQNQIYQVPVAQSLPAIVSLIEFLANLLHSSAFHQEKYGRLIISIVVQYYQKCHERFKEMVVRESSENTNTVDESNPHADLKLAAHWAQNPDVVKLLQELTTLTPDNVNFRKVLIKLRKLESQNLKDRPPLAPADLIRSNKKLCALAHLYTTLLSFLTFIRRLGSVIKPIPDLESEANLDMASLEAEWVKEFGPPVSIDREKSLFRLPLTYGLMQRFRLVSSSLSRLAQTILFTLLLELRLEAYYHIDLAFSQGQYYLNYTDSFEPDLKIIELNSLIKNYLENSTRRILNFRKLEKTIFFFGLINLLNDLMILNVKKLKIANENGFKKLARNSIALQQNLKSILLNHNLYLAPFHQTNQNDQFQLFDFHFERCIKFYQIASGGPQAVMRSIRSGENYTFEEYKKLLELLCLSDQSLSSLSMDAEESGQDRKNQIQEINSKILGLSDIGSLNNDHHQKNQSIEKRKRIYNECLIELHALVLEDEDDDDIDEGKISSEVRKNNSNLDINSGNDVEEEEWQVTEKS